MRRPPLRTADYGEEHKPGEQPQSDTGPRRPDINAAAADSPPPTQAAEAAMDRLPPQHAEQQAVGGEQASHAQPVPAADTT